MIKHRKRRDRFGCVKDFDGDGQQAGRDHILNEIDQRISREPLQRERHAEDQNGIENVRDDDAKRIRHEVGPLVRHEPDQTEVDEVGGRGIEKAAGKKTEPSAKVDRQRSNSAPFPPARVR